VAVPGDRSTTSWSGQRLREYAETDIELSEELLADAGIDTSTPIDVRCCSPTRTRGGPASTS
jgi:hypothetical protein